MTTTAMLAIAQIIQLAILAYLSYTNARATECFGKIVHEMNNRINELSERVDELEWWNNNPNNNNNN